MRCEDAQRRLLAGGDPKADAHLDGCATCFAILEDRDPLVGLLRAARPDVQQVTQAIAASVLRRWQLPRLSWRVGMAAAGILLLLATALGGLTVWLAPASVAQPLTIASHAVDILATTVNGLLAVPRVLFLERPPVVAGYAVLVVIVCGLWIRLYQSIAFQRRRVIR